MDKKEALIGTKWKCPRCRKTEKITEDGFDHKCYKYMERRSLEEHFEAIKWAHKWEMKLWFG